MSLFSQNIDILTEHLGYVPIALIDELINAVNDILYKCTAAMEEFLRKRYGPNTKRRKISDQDIQLGTAKLETLLESIVDRCFDNFELYTLRNLLTIPEDLITEGWIRLKHHKGIDFTDYKGTRDNDNDAVNDDIDREIEQLEAELYFQLELNSILKQKDDQITQELETFKTLNSLYPFLSASPSQLKDSVLFLSTQSISMIKEVQQIQQVYSSRPIKKLITASARDKYINEFAGRAIENSGIQIISQIEKKSEADSQKAIKAANIFKGVGER